jgi:hypothetical protein
MLQCSVRQSGGVSDATKARNLPEDSRNKGYRYPARCGPSLPRVHGARWGVRPVKREN